MGHMTQTFMDDVHDQVSALQVGAPIQRLGERLGFQEGSEEGQMSSVVFGLNLGTGSGGFECRHGGIINLAEQIVQCRAGKCISQVVVFL